MNTVMFEGFSVLGAVVFGILFGFAALAALPSAVVTTARVPVGQLLLLLVFAVFAGLLAAIFPARRAGKLDVLAAIASE